MIICQLLPIKIYYWTLEFLPSIGHPDHTAWCVMLCRGKMQNIWRIKKKIGLLKKFKTLAKCSLFITNKEFCTLWPPVSPAPVPHLNGQTSSGSDQVNLLPASHFPCTGSRTVQNNYQKTVVSIVLYISGNQLDWIENYWSPPSSLQYMGGHVRTLASWNYLTVRGYNLPSSDLYHPHSHHSLKPGPTPIQWINEWEHVSATVLLYSTIGSLLI